MHRPAAKGQIRPKISTMPRQQSEAAAFLDIYKLVIEKKRLQQELQSMDQRREQIITRLGVLDAQVTELEKAAHQLRDATAIESAEGTSAPVPRSSSHLAQPIQTGEFDTLFLEY